MFPDVYDYDQANERAAANMPNSDGREVTRDLMCYLRTYVREKPEMAALWCLGLGFVLGWKLKPW